ncbi:MAG: FtsX-like permease family protein [Planctomycetaceae bacterium]|nr:FtsX-like permease family protein [Planctomycetales bacterium]MCB9920836.1 FtsX-like permease family protein [Planctomycetaceae bacterium]
MSTFQLLCAELRHRRMNVILSLCALIAAATLFVASPTLLRGYQQESGRRLAEMQQETDRELQAMQDKAKADLAELDTRTKRIMRDLGFNLRIVHQNTDLGQLYANFVSYDMPEEYVQKLAASPEITKIVHLVASLKQMVEWDDKPRLLVGIAPEATQSHIEKKAPMGLQVKPGMVYLGQLAAEGHAVGDKVAILGKQFEVAHILPAHGRADEDIAIFMNLADAQEVLEKPGKISEILALGCKCKTIDRVEEVTAQLETVLPDTKVTEHRLQAVAREDQRKLVEAHHQQTMQDYEANRQKIAQQETTHRGQVAGLLSSVTSVVTPLIVFVCALWVGLLAWANVRERRAEIGLLRAIGKRSGSIATLFLGKAMLLGLASGVVGCLLGYFAARWLATSVFEVTVESFTPSLLASVCAILGTPLIAAMASYLPTLAAVNQDPAVVLSGE